MGQASDVRVGLEPGADVRLGQHSLGLPLRQDVAFGGRCWTPSTSAKLCSLFLHVILLWPALVPRPESGRRQLWFLVGVGMWGGVRVSG